MTPALQAAIAAITPGDPSDSPAYQAAVKAYGSELLPAIPGGFWSMSATATIDILVPRGMSADLFDHALFFRPVGCRGRITWRTVVVIGMPYRALLDDATVAPNIQVEADDLWSIGVTTWIRRDLSAWYPGWTQLVVSAQGLADRDAASFGFVRA